MNPTYRGALALALLLAAVGCSAKEASAPTASPMPASTVSAAGTEQPSSEYASAPTIVPSAAAATDKPNTANTVQQAAANEKSAPVKSSPTRTRKTYEPYTTEKPVLVGTAIDDTKEKAQQLHGAPRSTYVMDDGEEPISVSEYDGFNIGYNGSQKVEFIEVADGDIDPGLNGLRLGQTISDATDDLGKPDASTEYVLTYRTKTSILKLDVDPKTKTVVSIKMFRRTE